MELERIPNLTETLRQSCPQCGGQEILFYETTEAEYGIPNDRDKCCGDSVPLSVERQEPCFWCKRAGLVGLIFRTGVSIELQIHAFKQLGIFVHERLNQFGFRDVLRS